VLKKFGGKNVGVVRYVEVILHTPTEEETNRREKQKHKSTAELNNRTNNRGEYLLAEVGSWYIKRRR
jgi:hypothetical protein